MRPSTPPEKPPHGTVRGGETLLLNHSYIDADPATVKREVDHQVAAVKECVSSINSDVDAFNADVSGLIHDALKARLDKLQADADVVAALGVPPRQLNAGSGHGTEAKAPEPTGTYGRTRAMRYRPPGWSDLPEPQRVGPGTPRGPGRPKGPDYLQTAAEIVTAYQRLWAKLERRPHWSEVARDLGVDERTLLNARRHFEVDEAAIDGPRE